MQIKPTGIKIQFTKEIVDKINLINSTIKSKNINFLSIDGILYARLVNDWNISMADIEINPTDGCINVKMATESLEHLKHFNEIEMELLQVGNDITFMHGKSHGVDLKLMVSDK
jgi:hypothetical protein